MTIEIKKDALVIDGKTFVQPIKIAELEALWGKARRTIKPVKFSNGRSETLLLYTWDKAGIKAWANKTDTFATCIGLYVRNSSYPNEADPAEFFSGDIILGAKNVKDNDFPWKDADGSLKKMHGYHAVYNDVKFENRYIDSGNIEISYIPPKVKNYKYETIPEAGNPMEFDNFNFKLTVIEVLMYDLKLLKPRFDIYEFAEIYTKKKINIDSVSPLRIAIKYFQELRIPKELGEKITEIYMDGGNDIYMNIAPQWDGEDGVFNVNKISEKELSQLPNLKKITLMTNKFDTLSVSLRKTGIECKLL